MAERFYREPPASPPTAELRYDEDGLHIYWLDPVEGCWVAFRRVDCVGEEELPDRILPVAALTPDGQEKNR